MTTPEEALAKLRAGNERFASGNSKRAGAQHPFAIVLGCSDSRVPVETIFDQAPGNIFVVRVAGNFLTNEGLGSIEYSIAVLESTLILVLGHSNCGAVGAAVAFVENGKPQPGHIQDLVAAIEPAARATRDENGDWIANAVAENVRRTTKALKERSSIIARGVEEGALRVAGGVYDLNTRGVRLIVQDL